MTPIRVLLADDHALVRSGIRALLDDLEGVEVVAEADDGQQALALVRQHLPDVALMDIAMPHVNGLEAAERIRTEFPSVRVIILSMHATPEYVRRALSAGAAGYLLKGSRTAELELALQAVARGEVYLSPAASTQLVADLVPERRIPGTQVKLTPRQRQVLKLIAQGHTRKEIARALEISPKTVDTFRMQLMEQLHVGDVASLIRYAIAAGLVANPDSE